MKERYHSKDNTSTTYFPPLCGVGDSVAIRRVHSGFTRVTEIIIVKNVLVKAWVTVGQAASLPLTIQLPRFFLLPYFAPIHTTYNLEVKSKNMACLFLPAQRFKLKVLREAPHRPCSLS